MATTTVLGQAVKDHRYRPRRLSKPAKRVVVDAIAKRSGKYGRRWRRFRLVWLSEHPWCVDCEREGKLTAATDVDHIEPLQEGDEVCDETNVQSLCRSHHSRKTARECGWSNTRKPKS
jgi:5-methylcytosine-specific restriction protein A